MKLFSSKLGLVGLVLVLSIVADQATKLWAEASLATPRYRDHKVSLEVPNAAAGKTLQEFLEAELTWTQPEEVKLIANRFVTRDGTPMRAGALLEEGDTLELQQLSVTVVAGYFDFIYARNPGAAWSFLADSPESCRKIFFIATSILAIILISVFLFKAEIHQRRLIFALALVLGGAAGNLIDRIAYGYVIDFIAWHIDDAYWPTFNIADAWICIGVGLMGIELIATWRQEARAKEATENDKAKEA